MIAINSLEDYTQLARSLGNIVLALPEETEGFTPQNKYDTSKLIEDSAFLFDYEQGNEVDLESETTDHYVEDGSEISTSISNKPEIISTTGFVSELTTRIKGRLFGEQIRKARFQANKLNILSPYFPQLTTQATQFLNKAERLYRDAQFITELATDKWAGINPSANNAVVYFTGTETPEEIEAKINKARNQTNQQEAFQKLYSYWKKRTLFTVRTPFAVFKNCAIVSIKARQDDSSRHVSSFDIRFKVLRIVKTKTINPQDGIMFTPEDSSEILKSQGSSYKDMGGLKVGNYA